MFYLAYQEIIVIWYSNTSYECTDTCIKHNCTKSYTFNLVSPHITYTITLYDIVKLMYNYKMYFQAEIITEFKLKIFSRPFFSPAHMFC